MEQRMYMTTGELAKLMGITKETLFHYDEIGLFRPAVVMKNGYRYYEVSQMELLDAILLLKELRMPLKEIQELLGKQQSGKNAGSFFRAGRKNPGRNDKIKKYENDVAHRKEAN